MLTILFYLCVVAGTILAIAYFAARRAPVAYQDKDGFHLGSEPVPCFRCGKLPTIEQRLPVWVVHHECDGWDYYSDLRGDYKTKAAAIKAWNELFYN